MVSCLRSVPSRGMSRARPIHRAAIVAGLALLVLTSCAGGRIEETVDIDGTVVPARIKLATANVGGTYYPMGNAIAQVLSSELPGVSATAETSGGSGQNIRMLDANQVHLALANAAITFPARQGAEGFEKQFAMEVVISLHASINLFLALEGSGIAEIADLKGKRVSVGPAGGGWDYYVRPILAAHGVSYADFQPVYEGQANAIELLKDGAIDAVMVGGSIPHATILAATATHDIEYLTLDETALDSLRAEYPFIKKSIVPRGTYEGLDEDFWAVETGAAQLIVRSDADPDYVYLIAKTIYENRDAIAEMHPAGAEITPDRAAMDTGIPYHEGSLRYFSEIGLRDPEPDSSGD